MFSDKHLLLNTGLPNRIPVTLVGSGLYVHPQFTALTSLPIHLFGASYNSPDPFEFHIKIWSAHCLACQCPSVTLILPRRYLLISDLRPEKNSKPSSFPSSLNNALSLFSKPIVR